MGLLAVLVSVKATAQEDDIDALSRGGPSSAKELQMQAAAEPPKTDDNQELCVFYHKRGIANQRLGNYQRAVEDLRLALANNRPSALAPLGWGERWRIQQSLGISLAARGDRFAVIDYLKSVAQESQQSQLFQVFFANRSLAIAYLVLGDFAEADGALKQANDTLVQLRNTSLWARWGYNFLDRNSTTNAEFAMRQGNHAEAERLLRFALENAQKHLERMSSLFPQGHQDIRFAIGNVATDKVELAATLATRGKYGEAEYYARSGLEDRIAYFGFNTNAVSYSIATLGWSKLQQGDFVSAQKFYRHAIAATEGSGAVPHSIALAARRASLADTYIVQSRWEDAIKVFQERDAGLRSNAEQLKQFGSHHVSWALALTKTGQAAAAAEMVEQLITSELKRPAPNKYFLAQLRGTLAIAQSTLGKAGEALDSFREAIPEFTRRDQDDGGAENSGVWRAFWQRVILESYIGLLGKVHVAGTAPAGIDVADEAFRIADLARGSSVQEAISASAARAQLPDGELAALARKDQDALNRIVALNQVLGRLAEAPEAERLAKVIADMRAEIERLRKDHAAFTTEIRTRFPDYAELIDPKPAGLADIRRALAPGEALVSIYVSDTQAFVWTIGVEGKAAFHLVPVTRAEIEADVAKLRGAVEFGDGMLARLPAFDLGRAHKLYRMFLAPDEALWKDARVLNVIPDGALGQLPFSLLVTAPAANQPGPGPQESYRDVAWLARKVAIAQLPSANSLIALRRAPAAKANRQAFVGFGNPLFSVDATAATQRGAVRNLTVRKVADPTEDRLNVAAKGGSTPDNKSVGHPATALRSAFSLLSALPDTADELNEIAATLKADQNRDVYLGRQASEQNVKRAKLENRRVVAFATHGIASGEITGLDQPALVLANPALTGDSENDGFLTMEEVLGLKLDADWVVLSACNTASADGKGSEAVSGLGRAFFYAGARSLLVSNWAVETTSARLLTTELFRRQSENSALTRAEALKQSMLSLMDKSAVDATGRTTFSYAHPAFWAPFSLVGDGGR
jgi:CHAT domain-containing protein